MGLNEIEERLKTASEKASASATLKERLSKYKETKRLKSIEAKNYENDSKQTSDGNVWLGLRVLLFLVGIVMIAMALATAPAWVALLFFGIWIAVFSVI